MSSHNSSRRGWSCALPRSRVLCFCQSAGLVRVFVGHLVETFGKWNTKSFKRMSPAFKNKKNRKNNLMFGAYLYFWWRFPLINAAFNRQLILSFLLKLLLWLWLEWFNIIHLSKTVLLYKYTFLQTHTGCVFNFMFVRGYECVWKNCYVHACVCELVYVHV